MLTREDIEGFGWTHTGKSIDDWFKMEGSFDLGSWTAYKIIMHYGYHDQRIHIYADDPGMDNYELFRGVVKYRFELDKLMRMIGITNNGIHE